MEGGLREEAICRGDSKNATEAGGDAEEGNVPCVSAGFLNVVPWESGADGGNFDIEEEEGCDDKAGDDGSEDPAYGEMPEFDKEDGTVGGGGVKGS